MKTCFFLVFACLVIVGCAELPWIGVTVTNAPASLGSCMPEKPGGGCP